MKHLSQEQIVLHYYGDADSTEDARMHLAECDSCHEEFERVKALLVQIEPTSVPEPHESFEQKMWLNVRDRLPQKTTTGWHTLWSPKRWAIAGAMAVLVLAAFLTGRFSHGPAPVTVTPTNIAKGSGAPVPERVILVAVGDHLEKSQMLLVELMSADTKGKADVSLEQEEARDLLDSNRLYRQSAEKTGDPAITHTLDDLERVLVEFANGPSELTERDFEQIRDQIKSQGLLFKIRVIGSRLRKPAQQGPSAQVNQKL